MGIQNLLPNLASIAQDKSLAQYAGQRAAIDGYSWLHKASTCCAQELCLGVPSGSDKLIKSVMKKIDMLRRHRVEPYMVFDGAPLPAKAGTEQERLLSREKNLVKARAFLSQGNAAQANLHFQKAVDISPSMVRDLIVHLKAASVEYVVAPYEADAQLAFLEREQLVDFVISEDSDMLAWNCKRVLFKLDHEGCGKEIQIADLPRSTELKCVRNPLFDVFNHIRPHFDCHISCLLCLDFAASPIGRSTCSRPCAFCADATMPIQSRA